MTRCNCGAALLLTLGIAAAARASDPVGVYAIIDRVVMEPKEDAAELVQVWGVFALAENENRAYTAPARGYMYFQLPEKKADVAKKEWNDLKKMAGSGQCVAFAGRYDKLGSVRKKAAKPEKPDAYPLGFGVQKVAAERSMAKVLKDFKPVCDD